MVSPTPDDLRKMSDNEAEKMELSRRAFAEEELNRFLDGYEGLNKKKKK